MKIQIEIVRVLTKIDETIINLEYEVRLLPNIAVIRNCATLKEAEELFNGASRQIEFIDAYGKSAYERMHLKEFIPLSWFK